MGVSEGISCVGGVCRRVAARGCRHVSSSATSSVPTMPPTRAWSLLSSAGCQCELGLLLSQGCAAHSAFPRGWGLNSDPQVSSYGRPWEGEEEARMGFLSTFCA